MSLNVERSSVTTVVVSQGRDVSYLPQTLTALAQQTHAPDVVVLAVESSDHVPAGYDHQVVVVGAVESYAQALNAVREHIQIDSQWLWLLHADTAPLPDALDHLLRSAEASRNTAAVGPKQISWADDGRTLLEVGIRATRSGRRVPEIQADERDQGQLDSRRDVLGIGTAGMLVNREVLDEVGGLNSDFAAFGDGLELSRRFRGAGYRVIVEPSAKIRHARVSLGQDPVVSFAARRTAQVRNGLIAAPRILLPLLWVGYILAALPRALARLVVKEGRYARAELASGLAIAGIMPAVLRGRERVRSTSTSGRAALAPLEATPGEVRSARANAKRLARDARDMEAVPDPLTLRARADLRRHTIRGRIITVVIALALSIALLVPYASSGILAGGGLAPSTATAGDLWAAISTGWLPSGDGYHAPIDPLWVVIWPLLILGAPVGLTLGHVLTAIIWLAIPAAALAAYGAVGRFTLRWSARTVLALVWVSAPPFISALLDGRIAVVIAHIVLAVAVNATVRAWRGSMTAAGVCALELLVLSATTPAYLVIGVLIALAGCVIQRRWGWLLVVLPAAAMAGPTLRHWTLLDLGYLVTSPGRSYPATTNPYEILTFGATGWLLWVGIGALVLAAIVALLRATKSAGVRVAWLMIASGLAWALVAARIVTGQTAGIEADQTFGLPHFGQLWAWAGLVIILACGSYSLLTSLRKRSFGLAHIASAVVVVASTLSVPVLWTYLFSAYVADGANVALGEHTAELPAVAAEDERANLRVLALRASADGIDAELWRDQGIDMIEYSTLIEFDQGRGGRGFADAATHLGQAIADATSSNAVAASAIGDHAVATVLLPPQSGSTAQRDALADALSAVPGLTFVATNDTGDFWRLASDEGYPSRVRLSDGTIVPSERVSAGGALTADGVDRTLYLAERSDLLWRATLNGEELERVDAGWAQAWKIPAGASGQLAIVFADPLHRVLACIQVVAMVCALIAALPLRRRQVIDQ